MNGNGWCADSGQKDLHAIDTIAALFTLKNMKSSETHYEVGLCFSLKQHKVSIELDCPSFKYFTKVPF